MIEALTPQSILYIILFITAFDYLYSQVLDVLNTRARKSTVPEEISDFYDVEKYKKSQEYHKELNRFSFFSTTFSFIGSFLLLYLGGFGWLDGLVRPLVENEIFLSLLYFGVLFILSDLISLPFAIYSTFVIEARYGFNKTTPKLFIVDKLKGYGITILLGGALIGLLLYLILFIGSQFWLYFWIVATLFIVMMNMFYTSLFLPLFNKLTPLEDGEIKKAIKDYSDQVQFPLDNVYVIDGSKRSSKANAFFSGLGKRKKIVLYDTLINNHTKEELVAVLAHEVGHYKHKHIFAGLIISIGQIGLMLYIMSLMIYSEEVSLALGANQLGIHLNLLAFGILYSPLSTILGILGNALSRKNEFEADAYAKDTYGAKPLIQALKKLSVDNLSNLYPHPAYVFVNYSHPPLLKRLAALSK